MAAWTQGVAVEGLQQPHMEDIVEAGPLRMLQTIGHLANALDHLERASVAGAELTLWTALQREVGLCSRRSQTQSPTANSSSL